MSVMIYWCRWNEKKDLSHELLRQALENYLQSPVTEVKLEKGEQGKPRLSEWPDIHFSISHSKEIWGCAIGKENVGLDIQSRYTKNNEKLARRFFHDQEINWLEENGFEQFSRVWTYKESYVKYTGVGLSRGLDYFSVIPWLSNETSPRESDDFQESSIFQQEIPLEEDYWMVLSSSKQQSVTLTEL